MPSVNTAETENMATVTFGSSLIFYNVRDGASCSAPPQVYAPSLSPNMEIHREPPTNQNSGTFLQVMFSSLVSGSSAARKLDVLRTGMGLEPSCQIISTDIWVVVCM